MAGTPTETPERFVCMECYAISAGVPVQDHPEPKHYEPPTECGACHTEEFVPFTEFARAYHKEHR